MAKHIEAAAGNQSHDGGPAGGKFGQGGNTAIEVSHQLVYLLFQAKHGGNGGSVLPHALHHAQLSIGGQIHHRGDLAESVIAGGQAAADEDDIRLAGHDGLQIGLLDGTQIDNIIVDVILKVLQAGIGSAHYSFAHAQGIQNIQRSHIQNGDALRIIGHLQLRRLLVGIEAGDSYRLWGLVSLGFPAGLTATGRGGILGRISAILSGTGHEAQGHHTGQSKRKHLFHVHFWLLLF